MSGLAAHRPQPKRPDDSGAALSQTVRTQLRLRELILGGELKPGARIAELTPGRAPGRVAHADPHGAGAAAGRRPARRAAQRRLRGEGLFRSRHPRRHRAARHARRPGRAAGGRARRQRRCCWPRRATAWTRIDALLAAAGAERRIVQRLRRAERPLSRLLAEMAGSATGGSARSSAPPACRSPRPTASCWRSPPGRRRATCWWSRSTSTAACSRPSSSAKARAPKR